MNVVIKVNNETKEKMIEYYKDKCREKTPPYAIFQAMEEDTVITLYNSGKAMFQGPTAFVDANMWQELSGVTKDDKKEKEKLEKYYYASCVGSDEVGTGDYFGPIVVTASHVSKEKIDFVEDLGVRDSKVLTDEKIRSIAPTLIKEIPHCTFILTNKEYNKYQKMGYNMNKIKAILHNKVLVEMKKRQSDYDKIVVDQFVYPAKYFEHIKEAHEKVTDIDFTTKAESKCASVAVASCISRYIFLLKMNEISDEIHIPILKGAGEDVDKLAAEIVQKYGEEKLNDIAKLNFKNTEKLKMYL